MTDLRPQFLGSTTAGAILGNYRILEPLNRGGMGSVFRAEHAVLGRPAAVKILRPELTTNPQLVQRFLNEAKAATLIRHPGIVEVYDFGTTEDGTSYIVMELLHGVPLTARLAERGQLDEREAAYIMRGIASALKAAHQQGIIHRDLKPANIFLVPDPDGPTGERVKVLDFGIAKLVDPKRAHQTQTGALIGTPVYMPPEQARAASAIDHRADLYSLGCMAYEMLAGRPPFMAAGAGELIAMHLFAPPDPLRAFAHVSPELERIVMRLLEKEPGARFQHGGEVIDAVDQFLGQFPGAGARGAVPALGGRMPLALADERAMHEKEPRSAMGIIAGVITVAIAAGVGLFLASRSGGDDEKPAGGGSGSATATELAAPPSEPPALTPAPTPAPAPAPTPPPVPTPAPDPKEAKPPPAPAPAEPTAGKPAEHRPPRPTNGPGKRPDPKPGSASGPVTRPDGSGPVTRPDTGPITSPSGLRTPGGGPMNPPESLNEDKKPPPKPVEQPPPQPPPPPDKLPDKPSAPSEGAP